MAKTKSDFPVANIRRYLEPGPIVLVSSAWRGETNIMTMGWHTVLEFVPSLVGCVISSGNPQFRSYPPQRVKNDQCADHGVGLTKLSASAIAPALRSTNSRNSAPPV